MTDFEMRVEGLLDKIGSDRLPYNRNEFRIYEKTYRRIEGYAKRRELLNTLLALHIVRSLHDGTYRGRIELPEGGYAKRPYFCHCLSVCEMLINLHLPLTAAEEDIALAGALCHDLLVYHPELRETPERDMAELYHLDPQVGEIMGLIYEGNCNSSDDFRVLFGKVQRNKLAMLIRLSDRGNVVEELYNVPTWKAHEYIHETRTHYLPMCIFAREHYPELETVVGILQGKIYQLMEASEIFVNRYEDMEMKLTNQIIALQEENARIRITIRRRKELLEE